MSFLGRDTRYHAREKDKWQQEGAKRIGAALNEAILCQAHTGETTAMMKSSY